MRSVLILVDIQKEYTLSNRPFTLNGIEESLENCKLVLDHARKNKWLIAHVQHVSERAGSPIFIPNTPCVDFAEKFKPQGDEKVFIKNDYSCFSSNDFTRWIKDIYPAADHICIAGYTTTFCINSTLEEAYRLKMPLTLLEDATLAKSIGEYNESQMHEMLLQLWKIKGIARFLKARDVVQVVQEAL